MGTYRLGVEHVGKRKGEKKRGRQKVEGGEGRGESGEREEKWEEGEERGGESGRLRRTVWGRGLQSVTPFGSNSGFTSYRLMVLSNPC